MTRKVAPPEYGTDADRSRTAKAKERLRSAAAEAKRQVRQDLKTAERQARQKASETSARDVASRVANGAAAAGQDSPGVESPGSMDEIFARAEDAASVRSPMSATLDPGADGPALEQFASAGPMSGGDERRESESDARNPRGQPDDGAMLDASLITGAAMMDGDDDIGGFFGDDGDEDEPIAFFTAEDREGGFL